MSVASQSPTIRFFGALKNLFSKAPVTHAPDKPAVAPVKPAPVRSAPSSSAAAGGTNGAGHAEKHDGQVIVLPLQMVILAMTPELRSQVRAAVGDNLTVSVPIDKVLPQLGKGAVKIPFGEVRRSAPQIFATGVDHDNLPVVLPLAEVMSRINPTLLGRRNGQKQQAKLSDDIISPFNLNGQGLAIDTEAAATFKPAPASQPIPKRVPPFGSTPAVRAVTPLPPSSNTKRIVRVAASSIPTPNAPPSVTPIAPVSSTPTSVNAVKPSASFAFAPITPIAPDAPETQVESKPIPMPALMPKPSEATIRPQSVAAEPVQISPLTTVSVPAPAVPSGPPLNVALSTIVQDWPETLRQEIVKLNLAGGQVAVPSHLIEAGLKRGRVAFPWKQLRAWMTPSSSAASVHDEIEVALPLKIIAPMFLSQKKTPSTTQNAVAVDESIPNLFFGFPQPEPVVPAAAPTQVVYTPAAPPKPVDTNYYVFGDNDDTAFVDQTAVKRPVSQQASGTDFLVKYATPNEIVSRAAALDGVAGALIALPDGLMVASKVSEDLNAETLAAFLPQLFSKMTQCTKELRMGELNNLHFTVGNIPWKIFRVNAVFFAAFGRLGQPLPTSQLAALAGELDRRNKR